ncbi:MAG: hypothetical protein JNK87_16950 [Bryobacterales bacterium]|nr:hypothetical protein [Bryobacterales bacterium]
MRGTLLLLALSPLVAEGQSLRCDRVDTASEIRSESTAELLPDIVLRCAGAAGDRDYQVVVNSETPFTNRDLAPISSLNWAWNDALLLVDDPPPSRQVACAPPEGALTCPQQAEANVFQGKRLADASLVFQGVRIPAVAGDPPRTLRIVNLRVNAAAHKAATIETSVQMFAGNGVPVAVGNSDRTSATRTPSLRFAIRTNGGLPAPADTAALLITPRSLPLQEPSAGQSARVVFTETTATAFRRRNAGTTSADPKFLAAQPLPGAPYNTETGFYNPSLAKVNRTHEAGLADAGTRLVVQFTGIPADTAVWVTIRDAGSEVAPRALLTYTDGNGGGTFNPMSPWVPGWARLYNDSGKATAAWEVVSADPERIEEWQFSVALTALTGNPGTGTLLATGLLGPNASDALPSFVAPSTTAAGTPLISVATSLDLPRVSILSSASLQPTSLAPAALVSAFSAAIRRTASPPGADPVDTLAGVALELIDSLGRTYRHRVLGVVPGQANFQVPIDARPGPGVLNLLVDGIVAASDAVLVDAVAPALFSATGDGLGYPLGEVIRLGATTASQPLAQFDAASRKWEPVPITLSPNEPTYLSLLATGVRGRASLNTVSGRIGNHSIPAILAAPHPELAGVDRVTIGPIPSGLVGVGVTRLHLNIGNKSSQELTILIQ